MTDKERLEEIERQLNRAEIKRENLDIYDFQNILEHQLISGNLAWLVKYAKKQAERVHELELEVNDWREEVQKWQKFYKESEESHSETKELLYSTISEIKRYKQFIEEFAYCDEDYKGLILLQNKAKKLIEGENRD